MTRLRAGSSLIQWPRTVAAVAPGQDPAVLERSDAAWLATMDVPAEATEAFREHLTDDDDGEEDAVLAERLAAQDEAYGSWIPGFLETHRQRLTATQALHARRRLFAHRGLARPTLPVSTLRRALAIEAGKATTVLVDDDPDALGIVLAAGENSPSVTTVVPLSSARAWLEREAQRAAVGDKTQWVANASDIDAGSVDAAVVHVGSPQQTHRALSMAMRAVRPGGRIYTRVRAPWDEHLVRIIGDSSLTLLDHIREIDHAVAPGGFVVDGAGDLVVLERGESDTLPAPSDEVAGEEKAAEVRSMPYLPLDFHSLDTGRLADNPLERLFDAVAAGSENPEEMRTITREQNREVGAWYDSAGVGFSVELAVKDAHLLVTLMPYDTDLEWVVSCAVFHTLGDHLSRLRPHRTTWWREENVFG